MVAPIPMPTDHADIGALITLAQWLSPSFPIGAFSYSHGLETAVQTGVIRDADSLQAWLRDIVTHGAGRNDAILLAAAYRGDDLGTLDALARALAPSSERLSEAAQQGAAFVRTVNDVWGLALPDMTLPIAVGAAAAAQGLPLEEAAQMFLHAFVSSLTSAAIRAVPLGQTDGQRVIAALGPLCRATVATALNQTTDDIGSACFAADIASMQHETQYSRMFQT
jgi:urease accessory protein